MEPEDHEAVEKKQNAGQLLGQELRKTTKEHAGVAILVHNKLWQYLEQVQPSDGRIIAATFGFRTPWHVTCAYAPQAARPEDNKDESYDHLEEALG